MLTSLDDVSRCQWTAYADVAFDVGERDGQHGREDRESRQNATSSARRREAGLVGDVRQRDAVHVGDVRQQRDIVHVGDVRQRGVDHVRDVRQSGVGRRSRQFHADVDRGVRRRRHRFAVRCPDAHDGGDVLLHMQSGPTGGQAGSPRHRRRTSRQRSTGAEKTSTPVVVDRQRRQLLRRPVFGELSSVEQHPAAE